MKTRRLIVLIVLLMIFSGCKKEETITEPITEENIQEVDPIEEFETKLNSASLGEDISFAGTSWTIIQQYKGGTLLVSDEVLLTDSLDEESIEKTAQLFGEYSDYIEENILFLSRNQYKEMKDLIPVTNESWWLKDISSVTKKDKEGHAHELRYYVVGDEKPLDRGTDEIDDSQEKGNYSYSFIENEKIGIRPCLGIGYTFDEPEEKPIVKETENKEDSYIGEWAGFSQRNHLYFNSDNALVEVLYDEVYTGTYEVKDNRLSVSIDYGYEITPTEVLHFNDCLYVGNCTFVKKGEDIDLSNEYSKNVEGTYLDQYGNIWAFTKDSGVLTNTDARTDRFGSAYYYVTKEKFYILDSDGVNYDSEFCYELKGDQLLLYYTMEEPAYWTFTKTEDCIYDSNFDVDNCKLYQMIEECIRHYFGSYDASNMSLLTGPRNISLAEQNGGSTYDVQYISNGKTYYFGLSTKGRGKITYKQAVIFEDEPLLDVLPE